MLRTALRANAHPAVDIYDPALKLYLPFYDHAMGVSPFISKDLNHHTATVTGATWGSQGRTFDGADDVITVSDSDNWNFDGDFSILIWFNADSWAGNWYETSLMSQPEGVGSVPKWFFTYDGANTRFEFHTGVVLKTVLGTAWTANTGTYYQIGVKRVGSTWTFYKNGETNGTATEATAMVNATAGLLIGQGQGASDSFDGVIGEVLAYKGKGLSDAEFLNNYLATKWRYSG